MNAPRPVLPHGAWPSRLSVRGAAAGAVRFGGVHVGQDDGGVVVRWAEQRPADGGRTGLWRAGVPAGGGPAHPVEDPPGVSARSSVNEYGGGAWWVDAAGRVFWVVAGRQCICTTGDPAAGVPGGAGGPGAGAVHQVTPDPPRPSSLRHAAGVVTPDGDWIVCEREIHDARDGGDEEPVNELCAVPVRGGAPVSLVRDGDFCAGPALSPDGATLAWLRWDHPDMPWDAAELWAGALDLAGVDGPVVRDARRVAGGMAGGTAAGLGRAVSVCLPVWAPDGRLWWCDDSSDWWHLHVAPVPGLPGAGTGDATDPVLDRAEEVGEPRWISGGSRYGFTADGRVVAVSSAGGLESVWVWDPRTGDRSPVPGPGFTYVEHLHVSGSSVALVGGTPDRPTSVWLLDLDAGTARDLRDAPPPLPPEDVSAPEAITFPTGGGARAHALLYLPRSSRATGPEGELPPLVVRIHGGPTAAARAEFSTSVQFWTTRGMAVVDVNYRGSTGFGRAYRDLLRESWGVVDVEDCVAVARWLAGQGRVDGDRAVIRGGSAGGFTALEALCHRDGRPQAFAAACSLYGVTDLFTMVADTHKFESRYLDGLIGPLPGAEDRYRERSPLHHAERIRRPVLVLQGLEDPVVPPSQARVLLDALAAGGVPHASIFFAGEAHGFRKAGTIVAALEAELSFYGQVLGFTPDDHLTPVVLEA